MSQLLRDHIELDVLLGIEPGERYPTPRTPRFVNQEGGRPVCWMEVDVATGEIRFFLPTEETPSTAQTG